MEEQVLKAPTQPEPGRPRACPGLTRAEERPKKTIRFDHSQDMKVKTEL